MKILVTAGNTQTPVDRVRCLTNIFSGRTGARIALEAHQRHHAVTLLTSHPKVLEAEQREALRIITYRTFEDLAASLQELVLEGKYDVIIHCAAVSDFEVRGVYSLAEGVAFEEANLRWSSHDGPQVVDARAGKVKSKHHELWLRMTPTPKLIDKIRDEWGFSGILVKFKLEVGVGESELEAIAEQSRIQSQANLIVANTLEGMAEWAILGSANSAFTRVSRPELPRVLLEAIEREAKMP